MKKISTAIILCAGYGKRLRPLTNNIPKPLLKIKNITLLENTLNLIKLLGITKVLLNTFYLKNQIIEYLRRNDFNLDIDIIEERVILDTGGGVLNLIKSSDENHFIIFNPDTIWSASNIEDIKSMENFYFSNKVKNILLVVNKDKSFDKKLKGDFIFEKNNLINSSVNDYIFTGCQIIDRDIFKNQQNEVFPMTNVWKELEKQKNLYGFESKTKFDHISDIEIYHKLLKDY